MGIMNHTGDTPMIEMENVCIRAGRFSITGLSLCIQEKEFFLLLGPTGSGKTLTLEAIAGLVPTEKGSIRVRGKEVSRLPPEKRGIGIVYQDYALFPHMNVRENIDFGIRYIRENRKEAEKRIDRLMEEAGIAHLEKRSIHRLSGGEKQRTALVRALAVNPSVLLMDEPLSALDPEFRDDLQKMIKKLHMETGITCMMVTHDFSEALYLGDHAAVIHNGEIAQKGRVFEVFKQPVSPFVARFVGFKNVFPAKMNRKKAMAGGHVFPLSGSAPEHATHIAVRAEDIHIHPENTDTGYDFSCPGRIETILDRGHYAEVMVQAKDIVFTVFVPKKEMIFLFENQTKKVDIHIRATDIHPV